MQTENEWFNKCTEYFFNRGWSLIQYPTSILCFDPKNDFIVFLKPEIIVDLVNLLEKTKLEGKDLQTVLNLTKTMIQLNRKEIN